MQDELSLLDYFTLYGPFAVLFVFLFYWHLRSSEQREVLLRKEIRELRKESEERANRHYEVLSKFAEKYDLVIDKLNALEAKMDNQPRV
ncbi:BhlA/UviB family holin-like peptide [Marinicrinis sediminis]|uniref:BhlA/UviB family holin-like peptide n=1 Tax=Marinicrinis sediminis TaxID=1652465 RepID=A0ABW5R9B8_9BACL